MLVGLLKKKSWPTDPNFEDHSIENTHIIFGLTWKKHDPRELSLLKKKHQFSNSFFVKTLIDWNHLEDSVLCATSVESFKSALTNRQ